MQDKSHCKPLSRELHRIEHNSMPMSWPPRELLKPLHSSLSNRHWFDNAWLQRNKRWSVSVLVRHRKLWSALKRMPLLTASTTLEVVAVEQ
jgi:hypothetical protein